MNCVNVKKITLLTNKKNMIYTLFKIIVVKINKLVVYNNL